MDRYRHYKNGKVYRVLSFTARIESQGFDGNAQVVYRCEESGQVWVRPVSEFLGQVTDENGAEVPRFSRLG